MLTYILFVPTRSKAAVFQVLADPTRLALFERLAKGEATVTELGRGFSVSQPAISQHLAALRRCNLVSHRREGRNAIYKVRPEGLAPLYDWLEQYRKLWPERLDRLKNLLETSSNSKGEEQ